MKKRLHQMWHEHGTDDLAWQPELQAEREVASEALGRAAMYLTSVQMMYNEEFEQNGYISHETRQRLSEAHTRHVGAIAWMSELAQRIYDVEQ